MGADKPHGSGQVKRAFLLGLGPQAVVYHKALIAQSTERFCNIASFRLIAAKLECPAGADEYSAFYIHTVRDGKAGDVWPEVRAIGITAVVDGILCLCRGIAFLPQIQNLLFLRRDGGSCRCIGRGIFRHSGSTVQSKAFRPGSDCIFCHIRRYHQDIISHQSPRLKL